VGVKGVSAQALSASATPSKTIALIIHLKFAKVFWFFFSKKNSFLPRLIFDTTLQ
jgi:hypothetical protein